MNLTDVTEYNGLVDTRVAELRRSGWADVSDALVRNRAHADLKHRMPVGWCLAERLRLGHDIFISETPEMVLVETVGGLHAGTFSAWLPDGSKAIRCGTRHWAEFGTVEPAAPREEGERK